MTAKQIENCTFLDKFYLPDGSGPFKLVDTRNKELSRNKSLQIKDEYRRIKELAWGSVVYIKV